MQHGSESRIGQTRTRISKYTETGQCCYSHTVHNRGLTTVQCLPSCPICAGSAAWPPCSPPPRSTWCTATPPSGSTGRAGWRTGRRRRGTPGTGHSGPSAVLRAGTPPPGTTPPSPCGRGATWRRCTSSWRPGVGTPAATRPPWRCSTV